MKNTLLILLLLSFAFDCVAQEEDKILAIHDQLTTYYDNNPFEKVYLSTDKEVYKPGELVWFNAMVNNISYLGLGSVSTELDLNIYDSSGNNIYGNTYTITDGMTKSNMIIPEGLEDGKYFLVASTPFMLQADEAFIKLIFIDGMNENKIIAKDISVPDVLIAGEENSMKLSISELNGEPYTKRVNYEVFEGDQVILDGRVRPEDDGSAEIALEIPDKEYDSPLVFKIVDTDDLNYEHSFHVNTEKLRVQFYAEGGNYIAGTPLNIGFMVTNGAGQPIDIQATILNGGTMVTQARTLAPGYGIFALQANADASYQFQVTSEIGEGQTFTLPQFEQNGLVMSVQRNDAEYINANLIYPDGQVHNINLMATRGNQLFWASQITVNGAMRIKIPKETFEQGLCLLSAFDENGELISDRVLYVDKGENLTLSLDVDKEELGVEQPFRATVKSALENGTAIPGILTLSVSSSLKNVDEADDYISSFGLNSMLENYISQTSTLYTDGKLSENSLNYLLVSNSMKNFSWSNVFADNAMEPEETSLSDQVKQFASIHSFVQQPPITPQFYLANTTLFSEPVVTETKNEDRYIELLHSGTSILDVIKMKKQYRLDGNRIIFGGAPNSFNSQEGALIVVDGIKMGSSAAVLNDLNPRDIKSIFVSTNVNDIMQYTSQNTVGVIVIDTNVNTMDDSEETESVSSGPTRTSDFAEYLLQNGSSGMTTIFWDPNVEIGESGSVSRDILTNNVIGSFQVEAEFIDAYGRIGKATRTINVK